MESHLAWAGLGGVDNLVGAARPCHSEYEAEQSRSPLSMKCEAKANKQWWNTDFKILPAATVSLLGDGYWQARLIMRLKELHLLRYHNISLICLTSPGSILGDISLELAHEQFARSVSCSLKQQWFKETQSYLFPFPFINRASISIQKKHVHLGMLYNSCCLRSPLAPSVLSQSIPFHSCHGEGEGWKFSARWIEHMPNNESWFCSLVWQSWACLLPFIAFPLRQPQFTTALKWRAIAVRCGGHCLAFEMKTIRSAWVCDKASLLIAAFAVWNAPASHQMQNRQGCFRL